MIRDMRLNEINECLQNRYPFLFIDRVTEVLPGKYAKGYKCFTHNESYFQGHFMNNPNVPGAIQLEIMLEIFCLSFLTIPEYKGAETADLSVDALLFKKRLIPGDRLDVVAELCSFRRGIAKGRVVGFNKEEVVCSCEPTVCIPQILKSITPKRDPGYRQERYGESLWRMKHL